MKLTKAQIEQLLEESRGVELPIVPAFLEFMYSDEGNNDPLMILLEREENDEFTLETITINRSTTLSINFKKGSK